MNAANRAVRELLPEVTAELRRIGVESAASEARMLLGGALKTPAPELFVSERRLSASEAESIESLLRRRADREPIQYILGTCFFYDSEFEVTPSVLIPRPETELLVEWAVRELPRNGTLLDLGTGSGAIALSVAKARPDASVLGADVSAAALEVAERNRIRLKLDNVRFIESDLFSALDGLRFDLAAANLPYVPECDRAGLAPEVRDYEPALALFAGDAGFALLERTGNELSGHLNSGGKAIFELDPRQAERMRELLERRGFAAEIRFDLSGRKRFVAGVLHK